MWFVLLASRFSAHCALSPLLCFPPGRWLLPGGCCPHPPLLCLAVFVAAAWCSVFFFLFRCAPQLSLAFFGFRPWVPWALALCVVCLAGLPLLGTPDALISFVLPAWPLAAPWWLLPPPPFCFSRFSSLPLGAPFFFLCCFALACLLGARRRFLPPAAPSPPRCVPGALCCLVLLRCAALPFGVLRCCIAVFRGACRAVVPRLAVLSAAVRCLLGCLFVCCASLLVAAACCAVSLVVPSGWVVHGVACCLVLFCIAVCRAVLCVPRCGAAPYCCGLCCPVLCCCVVCRFVALVWCRCLLCRALWRCPSPWGPVLCGAVFCGVPPRCVLCAVCVLAWRAGACCCSLLGCVLCVSWGVVPCVPCPLRSVRCCAFLCWYACVVLFVWCVLLLAPGAVVRCCVLCCFLWCSVVRCWVWWPVVVNWWCVLVSVSLSGRVVCLSVVAVVCCGAQLPCVVFPCALLSFCNAV